MLLPTTKQCSIAAPPGISPRDPMWIGRWWAGFLFIGAVLLLPSLGLFCFPAQLQKAPSKAKEDRERGLTDCDKEVTEMDELHNKNVTL